MLREADALRYLAPLREGGSLPGLVEADDDGTYVMKLRAAGQGSAALVAEVVVGELGRRLGVRVPELVLLGLDAELGRREPDPEVSELLRASTGLNLGVDFLPGSIGYDGTGEAAPWAEALRIFWLDTWSANIDRTWRNPNLLLWHGQLWAIDHGAALIFQHSWPGAEVWAGRRYDLSAHVLSPVLADPAARAAWPALDEELAAAVSEAALSAVLELVPDEWLTGMNAARGSGDPAARWRQRYLEYLLARTAQRPWAVLP